MAIQILFDFTQANLQANRLEEAASSIRSLSSKRLADTRTQLNTAWQGESATIYMEKLRELQESITKTAADLEKVAANLRYRSRKIHEAELLAQQIAQNNSYGGGSGGGAF